MTHDWQNLLQKTLERRHWLHQHPELRWEEQATAEMIRGELSASGISWRACAGTGTVASLPSGNRGPHIAFRADIDALPIREPSGVPYASIYEGKMHACGHDGHTAVLLALAEWLKRHEGELPGPVSFLFQPAEEGGHGAKKMIEDGALEGIDRIYGWHNWPAMALGRAACPDGTVMSGNGTFHIRLKGRGGHASQPEAARDPVLAAAALTLNLQQIVSRRLPPQVAAVVSVTSIDARSNLTVIPSAVSVGGSIRFSEPQWREPIFELIEGISRNTAATYGVEAEVETVPRYEATINHPEAAALYRKALEAEFVEPFRKSDVSFPLMASEDFSYYLNEIPGAFALIGMGEAGAEGMTYGAPCHSPDYVFNDAVVEPVVRVFSRIAGAPIPLGSYAANR